MGTKVSFTWSEGAKSDNVDLKVVAGRLPLTDGLAESSRARTPPPPELLRGSARSAPHQQAGRGRREADEHPVSWEHAAPEEGHGRNGSKRYVFMSNSSAIGAASVPRGMHSLRRDRGRCKEKLEDNPSTKLAINSDCASITSVECSPGYLWLERRQNSTDSSPTSAS